MGSVSAICLLIRRLIVVIGLADTTLVRIVIKRKKRTKRLLMGYWLSALTVKKQDMITQVQR
ncbi:MAG: hypothetical protein BWY72_01185 [Bacteroidetes bacterium ADurb.Bin416]|nr:MAG: hypothetical protein BWY72_01185 [Bacteroidetes bacterium ADurb.Bin416]